MSFKKNPRQIKFWQKLENPWHIPGGGLPFDCMMLSAPQKNHFYLSLQLKMAYKISDIKATTKDRCRSMLSWQMNNAVSWYVPKGRSWKPKPGNPTCSQVAVPLPQRWAPAASPVLWLWGWDLLPKLSCQNLRCHKAQLGLEKVMGRVWELMPKQS